MKKKSKLYIIIILVIIFLEIIPYSRSAIKRGVIYIYKPFTVSVSAWALKSNGLISGISEISDLKRQNAELTAKLKELTVSSVELEELRHENDVLKKQLGFLEDYTEQELIPARIIGKEPFGALDKIIIDRGSYDGINSRSAVVSNGSLIGRVSEVYQNQSKITLITSKDSIIQVMLQKSRTLGILKGSLDGVKMEDIPQDTIIEEDEAIITSGLGGEISPGILIGWEGGNISSKSEIYKKINVNIAEDLNKLEYVFVIK